MACDRYNEIFKLDMKMAFRAEPVPRNFILEQLFGLDVESVIPLLKSGQTLLQAHRWLKSKRLARLGRVRVKTQYVAGSGLFMDYFGIGSADDASDLSGKVIDGDFATLPQIDGLSNRFVGHAR